jgi:hypothetical protein
MQSAGDRWRALRSARREEPPTRTGKEGEAMSNEAWGTAVSGIDSDQPHRWTSSIPAESTPVGVSPLGKILWHITSERSDKWEWQHDFIALHAGAKRGEDEHDAHPRTFIGSFLTRPVIQGAAPRELLVFQLGPRRKIAKDVAEAQRASDAGSGVVH